MTSPLEPIDWPLVNCY